jgi:hypothetical protein
MSSKLFAQIYISDSLVNARIVFYKKYKSQYLDKAFKAINYKKETFIAFLKDSILQNNSTNGLRIYFTLDSTVTLKKSLVLIFAPTDNNSKTPKDLGKYYIWENESFVRTNNFCKLFKCYQNSNYFKSLKEVTYDSGDTLSESDSKSIYYDNEKVNLYVNELNLETRATKVRIKLFSFTEAEGVYPGHPEKDYSKRLTLFITLRNFWGRYNPKPPSNDKLDSIFAKMVDLGFTNSKFSEAKSVEEKRKVLIELMQSGYDTGSPCPPQTCPPTNN